MIRGKLLESMPIRLAQAQLVPRGAYLSVRFCKSSIGQRFQSGGNLQHTVETHYWRESPIKLENELVEIGL